MQPHSARVCNKLLSELVMINTKVTSNLSLCFTDSNDSDSLQWWCSILVWWKFVIYISSRQKTLKFEIWSLTSLFESLSTRSQSFPDKNTTQRWAVLVLGDCCLRNAAVTVSDFITFVLTSYACRLLVAQWYETRGIVDTRDTCTVSRYFLLLRCTAIYRDFGDTGIVT